LARFPAFRSSESCYACWSYWKHKRLLQQRSLWRQFPDAE
jgi:hypothetical protein